MAARSAYAHKGLAGKNGAQMQEMLFAKGINFNDYPPFFERGTFIRREATARQLADDEILAIPERHRPVPDAVVTRSRTVRLDMPRFGSVTNREAVIFDQAQPLVAAPPAA
jgi:tRNA(His) 5'-end guanylyltransferase